jgi:tetratricopeptide (TPR) repeat protein
MIVFFETRSRLQEGQAFFANVAARLAELQPAGTAEQTTRHRLWGMALAGRGLFLAFMTRYEEAIAVTANGLALVRPYGLKEEIGYCLFVLAAAEQGLGQYETAVRHLEESIAELSELQDPYRVTHSRLALGQVYAWLGEVDKARELYETGLKTCDEIGDLWAKMIGQMLLGELMLERGEGARARRLLEESLAFLRKLEDLRWIVSCLINLGRAAFESGDEEQARGLYQEGAAIARKLEDRRRQTICLTALGRIETRRGAREEARAYLLQALRIGHLSQSVPELLEALLELAKGLAHERQADRATKLLAVVLAHPGSKQRTLVEARELRENVAPSWTAERRPAEARREDEPPLGQVIEEILAAEEHRAAQAPREIELGATTITEGANHA